MRRFLITPTLVLALVLTMAGQGTPATADGPLVGVTASPSSGLADGQVVEISAHGFAPNSVVGVVQCPSGTTDGATCLGTLLVQRAEADGSARFNLAVDRTLASRAGPIDCAVEGACVVLVYDASTGESAAAPISFFAFPTTVSRFVIDGVGQPSTLAADGSITFTGSLTCSVNTTVAITVTVTGVTGMAVGRVENQPCGPVPASFAVVARSTGTAPEPGQARFDFGVRLAGDAEPTLAGSYTLTLTRSDATTSPGDQPDFTGPTGSTPSGPPASGGVAQPVTAPPTFTG